MKLEFGNLEHIAMLEQSARRNKRREAAFQRSGLTKESFLIKEELKYWGNPTKLLYGN